MDNLFEIVDKSGRKIRLTKKQWKHIMGVHPEIAAYLEDIQKTLKNPVKIISQEKGNLRKFYSYHKNRRFQEKYLRLIVKYLNGEGFIITIHFIKNIK